MDITGLIVFLAIGALAGWLAGKIIKGGGFGLLGNIITQVSEFKTYNKDTVTY